MTSYPRPSELTLEVTKERVAGSCPECGADDLAAHPVLGEGGWFLVVKVRPALYSVQRERWALLGPVDVLVSSL